MSEMQSEQVAESVKDETSSFGKVSPLKSRNDQPNYEDSKFEEFEQSQSSSKLKKIKPKKISDLTGLLKDASDSRRSYDQKYSDVYYKLEKLKKEYDNEIGRINGLRNKSLYLYKLKKDADAWNRKRDAYLEKMNNQQNTHKLTSKNNKMMQERLISQIRQEILHQKQESVKQMKEKSIQLNQESLRNLTDDHKKRLKLHNKIADLHHIQEIKKEKRREEQLNELKDNKNDKIQQEGVRKEDKMKKIEDLQRKEIEMLRKIRECHKIHELALFEYADLRNQSLANYEKKYQKPIKLNPIV